LGFELPIPVKVDSPDCPEKTEDGLHARESVGRCQVPGKIEILSAGREIGQSAERIPERIIRGRKARCQFVGSRVKKADRFAW